MLKPLPVENRTLLSLPVGKNSDAKCYLRLLRKLHPRGSNGRWIRYWPWLYANHRKRAWADLCGKP